MSSFVLPILKGQIQRLRRPDIQEETAMVLLDSVRLGYARVDLLVHLFYGLELMQPNVMSKSELVN